MRLADGVDLDQIAGLTTGFTGADLANLVNEAAIVATRRKADAVTLDDFTAAIERIVAGLEKKSRVLGPAERSRVAHHEMGHALVAATLPGVDPVHKVSIIPRGVGALGYTMQRPTEDRFLLGRQELENRIAVLMGGRAAEALIFDGEVSTGASDDLQRATQIAMEMVTRYGMNETVGQRTYAPPPQPFLAGAAAEQHRRLGHDGARDRRRGARPGGEGLRPGDRHPALAPCRSRRRRPPAARAGDPDRRSIPRDPLDRAAGKARGVTWPLSTPHGRRPRFGSTSEATKGGVSFSSLPTPMRSILQI